MKISLKVFKAVLDGALSTLLQCKRNWSEKIFKVPSKPGHCTILWYSTLACCREKGTSGSNPIWDPASAWESCKSGYTERPQKDYIQSDYRSCSFLGYYYFAKIRKNHKALHFVLPNILHSNCPHLYFFKHFSFRNNSQEEIFVFLLIRELFLLCTIQLFLCLWITFGYVLTNFGLREVVLLF